MSNTWYDLDLYGH